MHGDIMEKLCNYCQIKMHKVKNLLFSAKCRQRAKDPLVNHNNSHNYKLKTENG